MTFAFVCFIYKIKKESNIQNVKDDSDNLKKNYNTVNVDAHV